MIQRRHGCSRGGFAQHVLQLQRLCPLEALLHLRLMNAITATHHHSLAHSQSHPSHPASPIACVVVVDGLAGRLSRASCSDTEPRLAPMSPLGVVSDGVVRPQPDPLGDGPVLLLRPRELLLRAEGLVGRHLDGCRRWPCLCVWCCIRVSLRLLFAASCVVMELILFCVL